MSDIDEILKKIERITAPVRQYSDMVNKIIPPSMQRLNEVMMPAIQSANEIARLFEPIYSQINSNAQKLAEAAKRWQKARKEDVAEMAEKGWYPNWFTFFYEPENEINSFDELMIQHCNDDWDEITSKILELCPNRAHILESAFSLHKSGNYIASVPLFISQADGICCESLKSFLFTGNDVKERIKTLIDSGEVEASMFIDVFLEPFKLKNHYNAGISKSSEIAKAKAPNRNGILHGHRKHLDYGTEINSLKSFSLLSFIVYSTKELIEDVAQ